MHDTDIAARLDAAWGDPGTWVANGLQWTHLAEVRAMINRRVTGNAALAPVRWFTDHVGRAGGLPLRRVLVLGCGGGHVERKLVRSGRALSAVAFDLSARVLERARARAVGLPSIEYVQASMDDLPVGTAPFLPSSFDAVLGVASVHHCSRLPALYDAVARLLRPGGWLFLDEYVGPDRFQYTAAHMAHVEALAQVLPKALLATASGQIKGGFRAPTVAEVVAVDPTEAACSSQIVTLLRRHFDIEAHRPYGGSLLHVLLADVAQNFKAPAAKPWLHALIEAEEELARQGTLEHHFSCTIARLRPAATA